MKPRLLGTLPLHARQLLPLRRSWGPQICIGKLCTSLICCLKHVLAMTLLVADHGLWQANFKVQETGA